MVRPDLSRARASTRALSLIACVASTLLGCAEVVPATAPAPVPEARTEARDHDRAIASGVAQSPTLTTADTSDVEGLWYLSVGSSRMTLQVSRGNGVLRGALALEGDSRATMIERVAWDATRGRMRFHRAIGAGVQWFDLRATDGVLTGRMAYVNDTWGGAAPLAPSAYRTHVTGWNSTAIDRAPTPRVFDLRWSDGRLGRVRIDRASNGDALVGSLKVYADTRSGAAAEQEELDLADVRWDGANLSFSLSDGSASWRYRGAVTGRFITGEARCSTATFAPVTWTGARAEVLAHGLTPRSAEEHDAWSARARRQIALLAMAGNPTPVATRVETVVDRGSPIVSRRSPDPASQRYTLSELRVAYDLADASGAVYATRAVHLFVARPTTAMPRDGYPLVLATNGHFGSAHAVMDPDNSYGYGDTYARRGYVVVAVDVSHRAAGDRDGLYGDFTAGDHAAAGNGAHPSIHAAGLDSDWEEDGERAWDVMRSLDLARAMPGVDTRRVIVTGLSMGGEVATYAGALDPRVSSVVVAGFTPDLGVISYRANHPCWRWTHADVREYLGVSVLHALVAPRLLVVETGINDSTFSSFRAPFASDKQVLRRSRAAWGDRAYRLVHFLHDGAHVYRTGDPSLDLTAARGISIPVQVAPASNGSVAWQTDPSTQLAPMTVFELTTGAFGR